MAEKLDLVTVNVPFNPEILGSYRPAQAPSIADGSVRPAWSSSTTYWSNVDLQIQIPYPSQTKAGDSEAVTTVQGQSRPYRKSPGA